ncbi:hypothetical protein [Okeania sp. SIO2B3]|uniref:hypothetical protein n=1 Tax=Okeania sp. SIO2B3 TaxID=2607784 RepID=UPI0013C0C9E6|nr:hypothetical protein [Okeania sp. SIO2B3]NET41006.1 hypothetical protein [Okeania sp. SIO2B3]
MLRSQEGRKKEQRRKKQEKRGRKGESFLITNYLDIILYHVRWYRSVYKVGEISSAINGFSFS